MDLASALVLRAYFKEYYFRYGERITEPTEIRSREFGYSTFDGQMIRHLSFEDIGALRALLLKEVPAGVYCSNSLYREPAAEMHRKGWIKAELIFDIDADALKLPCRKEHDFWVCKQCGKKEMGLRPETCPSCRGNRIAETKWACRKCLEGAKNETFKLLDILESDFGISGKQIQIYFSGNAGYHVHLAESPLDELDQHGRSEISDYLTARGILPEMFRTTKMSPQDPGWRGRLARKIRDMPENDDQSANPLKANTFEDRVKELAFKLSKSESEKILIGLFSELSVKIDPMVTTDIHRIFRMPETLNNKTGLVKKSTSDLASFDPLNEAVAIPDESSRIKVLISFAPKVELCGSSYGPFVENGESVQTLPPFVAIYLIAKGVASIAPPPEQSITSKN